MSPWSNFVVVFVWSRAVLIKGNAMWDEDRKGSVICGDPCLLKSPVTRAGCYSPLTMRELISTMRLPQKQPGLFIKGNRRCFRAATSFSQMGLGTLDYRHAEGLSVALFKPKKCCRRNSRQNTSLVFYFFAGTKKVVQEGNRCAELPWEISVISAKLFSFLSGFPQMHRLIRTFWIASKFSVASSKNVHQGPEEDVSPQIPGN